MVSEPVADEVLVTGVDEDGNIALEQLRDELLEGLGLVSRECEPAKDVVAAAGVVVNVGAEGVLDVVEVHVFLDELQAVVAEAEVLVLAGAPDVVDVEARLGVRLHEDLVAHGHGEEARDAVLGHVARGVEQLALLSVAGHLVTLLL